MSSFEKLSELVDNMKGDLDISYRHHTCGWYAYCNDKRNTRKWSAHEIYQDAYDAQDGFATMEEACEALLQVIEVKEFKHE